MGENCTLFDFDRLDGGFGSGCHSSALRSLHFSPYLRHTGLTIDEVYIHFCSCTIDKNQHSWVIKNLTFSAFCVFETKHQRSVEVAYKVMYSLQNLNYYPHCLWYFVNSKSLFFWLSNLILGTPRTSEVAYDIFTSTDIPVLTWQQLQQDYEVFLTTFIFILVHFM